MYRGLRWLGFIVLLLACGLPVRSADEPKKDKKPAPSTDKKDTETKKKDDKKSAEPDDDKKTAKKAPPAPKLTASVLLKNTIWYRAKMGKLDNAPKYGIVMQEQYVNGNKIALRDKEIELPSSDELIVRTSVLPLRFDDKGNPIKKPYTSKELEALRGPDKIGFLADVDNLKPGQIIDVYLRKKKNAGKDDLPEIVLIHILAEPSN